MNRVPVANSLLAALPRAEYQRLLAGIEPVTLTFGEVLYQPGEPIRHTYFPNDCLVSLLAVVEGRTVLEIGLVGSEGMVGIPLALGAASRPFAADDLRSCAVKRIPPYARISCAPAGRATGRRHQGGRRPAATEADQLQPRRYQDS